MAAFDRIPERTETAPGPRRLWRFLVGDVLRGERRAQRRILTEVAAAAGVSPQYLSEIERGRKEPSSEVLAAVGAALGLELVDLVARVADELAAGGRRRAGAVVVDLRSAAADPARVGTRHPLVAERGPGALLLAA